MAQLAANAKSKSSPTLSGFEMQPISTPTTPAISNVGRSAPLASGGTKNDSPPLGCVCLHAQTTIVIFFSELIDGEFHRFNGGLSWPIAAAVTVGELAGAALVALPVRRARALAAVCSRAAQLQTAVQGSGWFGPFPAGMLLVFAVAIGSTLSALQLSKCWRLLLRYW